MKDSEKVKIVLRELRSAVGAAKLRTDTAENIRSNVESKNEQLSHGSKIKKHRIQGMIAKMMLDTWVRAHSCHLIN